MFFRKRLEALLSKFVQRHLHAPAEQLESVRRALEGGTTAVYAFRFPSRLIGRVFAEYCAQNALPIPHYSEAASFTEQGETFYGFLRDRPGSEILLSERRKYRLTVERELSSLIAARGADTIRFIPVTIFAGSPPDLISPVTRLPIDFRRFPIGELWTLAVLILFRHRLRLDLGPVVSPARKREGLSIFQRLSLLLYRKEKRFLGTQSRAKSSPEESILGSGDIKRQLLALAQERALTRGEAEHRARQYLREIAARFSGVVVAILRQLLRWIFGQVFDEVEIVNLHQYREIAGEHPIILLPNHRSHFDYLLLTYALDREGLSLPHIAAGDNLNFFFVGYFLRRSGGFFIRRKMDDDPLYKLILNQYLTYLLKQGHTIEFYIEGGRSRTGAMLSPRLGLLKYIVRSILTGTRRDVYFMPVGISYERVAEDNSLARERLGQPKQRESFLNALRLTKIWQKRFGSVTINFGNPVSLKTVVKTLAERDHPEADPIQKAVQRTQPTSALLLPEVSPFTAKLAKLLVREIERSIPLTPTALFCSALGSFPDYEATPEQLVDRAIELLQVVAMSSSDIHPSEWQRAIEESGVAMNGQLRMSVQAEDVRSELLSHLARIRTLEVFETLTGTQAQPASQPIRAQDDLSKARIRYYAGAVFPLLLPAFKLTEELKLDQEVEPVEKSQKGKPELSILCSKEQVQERVSRLRQALIHNEALTSDGPASPAVIPLLKGLRLLADRLEGDAS